MPKLTPWFSQHPLRYKITPPRPANPSPPSNEVTIKKGKKVRDPNKPKRSKNAFMLFSDLWRPEIKAAFPDMKSTDISKELGGLWNALSDEDKKPFELQAATEKEAYDKAMVAYTGKPSPRQMSVAELLRGGVITPEQLGMYGATIAEAAAAVSS